MSSWPVSGTAPALLGVDGELVLLHIDVEPKSLEDFLDLLSRFDFPVNPDLHHRSNSVTVTFPAYSGRIPEIRKSIEGSGFEGSNLIAEQPLATHA